MLPGHSIPREYIDGVRPGIEPRGSSSTGWRKERVTTTVHYRHVFVISAVLGLFLTDYLRVCRYRGGGDGRK